MPADNIALLHRLRSIDGWIDLKAYDHAEKELLPLLQEYPSEPDVLRIEFRFWAEQKLWDQAAIAATKLNRLFPNEAEWWLNLAYALRRAKTGGLKPAFDTLAEAHLIFPKNAIIPYNLACYACQMGDTTKIWWYLERAMRIGGRDEIKKLALSDEDLKPVWAEIPFF